VTATATEQQLDDLLLRIEREEMRSLRWGATSASLSEDDLIRFAREIAGEYPEGAAGELLERRLLFRVPAPGGSVRYRSRFGEGVRLLTSLRQIFPGGRWEAAPQLVADFRADLRERQFPRRDRQAQDVIGRLASRFDWNSRDVAIAAALLSDWYLSAFQERASESILRRGSTDSGVVISAGTGAGKTLAYYFPAIMLVAGEVRPEEFWTKAVSVYPRNELLKDQFAEAIRYVQLIGGTCNRPLRIATLFGPTPQSADLSSLQRSTWERLRGNREDFVCPFAVCPNCSGRLIWREEDISTGREKLVCEGAVGDTPTCQFATDPTQVLLTRDAVRNKPPDLLFTTAEMLNQRMSDPGMRHAFGLGQDRRKRPLLMLLDEVHTYEGVPGAQAAMVFRRWRYGVDAPVRWVGLSATLRGGPAFFSQVTGVPESAIVEVAPSVDELETRAAEYQLILRGDPLSQTSLLSTSIQTSFLLSRLLDPEVGLSRGRAGKRTFVFTDDLDVTNRLFHDLRDAERQNLALERATDRAPGQRAFAAGQQWRLVEEIGWELDRPLDVSRTSSQDTGVNSDSQLVVATASLEVGFDDNRVGAVVQHKSPYRASSFVQRKGRGGRTHEMRPWMVTVLSDYGRDRTTYQAYERLFDPIVEPLRLPIANGYVRRIHAAFAFIDWLATRLNSRTWWWWGASRPGRGNGNAQRELAGLLEKLLDRDQTELGRLNRHLQGALALPEADVDALLWQPPRSLMLEVLPTLARRLATNWVTAAPTGRLDAVSDSPYPRPLPEFLPPNLFTDLNLPEVTISGPGIEAGTSLLVEQALRHLAPGRVTRRFAPGPGETYHWVSIPHDGTEQHNLPLSEFISRAHVASQVEVTLDGTPNELTVYRPWEMSLSVAPTGRSGRQGDLLPSSNARLRWYSEIIPQGEALRVEAAHDPIWSKVIASLGFYLHDQRTPLTVRRFAAEAKADLRRRGGSEGTTVQVRFLDPYEPDKPAAIGYEAEVDGLAVRFREFDEQDIAREADTAPSLRVWRTAYVRDLVLSDAELPAPSDIFLRERLFEAYLLAVVSTALKEGMHASSANELLRTDSGAERFEPLLASIFYVERKSERVEEGDVGSEGDDAEERSGGDSFKAARKGLSARLLHLLQRSELRSRLADLFAECWTPNPATWQRWLGDSLHNTLSEAARAAALSTAPDHVTEDSVWLDLGRQSGARLGGPREAWITESAIGGAGVVEAVATSYASEPRSFFRAFEFELLPGEFELSSNDLDATVRLGAEDAEVRAALSATQGTDDHEARDEQMHELSSLLQRRGISPGHAFLAALNQRVLRPGMTEDACRLLSDLVTFWTDVERDHGVALDLRTFCSLAAQATQLGPRQTSATLLEFLAGQAGVALTSAERAGVLMGLLWPRSHEARRHALGSWSPFRDAGFADPALLRELLLRDEVPEVPVADPEWDARVRTALARTGIVRVRAEGSETEDLQATLLRFIAEPVDVGFLQLFPVVEQLRREERAHIAVLALRGIV